MLVSEVLQGGHLTVNFEIFVDTRGKSTCLNQTGWAMHFFLPCDKMKTNISNFDPVFHAMQYW